MNIHLRQRVYRPDIDGLRTIAVLSVMTFHGGIFPFSGGFIGVDIFFVISAYLIGGHVYGEISTNNFTFADFFAKRARRIIPALFTVLIFSYILGFVILMPTELNSFCKSAIATIFAVSNIFFFIPTTTFRRVQINFRC